MTRAALELSAFSLVRVLVLRLSRRRVAAFVFLPASPRQGNRQGSFIVFNPVNCRAVLKESAPWYNGKIAKKR